MSDAFVLHHWLRLLVRVLCAPPQTAYKNITKTHIEVHSEDGSAQSPLSVRARFLRRVHRIIGGEPPAL